MKVFSKLTNMFMYLECAGGSSCLFSDVSVLFERSVPPDKESRTDNVINNGLKEVSCTPWTKTIGTDRQDQDDVENVNGNLNEHKSSNNQSPELGILIAAALDAEKEGHNPIGASEKCSENTQNQEGIDIRSVPSIGRWHGI